MELIIKLPKPHDGQKKVLQSNTKFKVLMCGRRWGKSLVCQRIAIKRMINGQKIAYVTPTFSLAKDFYKEFLRLIPDKIIESENKTDLMIELKCGGTLQFFSGEALERFRGLKFHYLIIDEAAHIPALKEAWGESILPTLIDYDGDAILISTPCGKEFFHSLYMKGKNGEKNYESWHYTTYDNPTLSPSAIEELVKELTEAQHKQEILAIAGENANNPIGTNYINENIIKNLSSNPTLVYGIDVAKYNDWTVITGLDSKGQMTYYDRFQLPWEMTKEKIKKLPKDIFKIMDSTGVGDVLLESLQTEVSQLSGFKFTTESKPKLIYEMIRKIERGELKYNQQTADEMLAFEYIYTSTGHIKFQAKQGYHDDSIMALAMASQKITQAAIYEEWSPIIL
jgi:hypothetical protein